MSLSETAAKLDIYKGCTLSKCHKVMDLLGQGGFGFVTKCCNTETDEMVAIKVNKSRPEIFSQAKLEIGILKRLRCLDPDTCNIVKWNGFFFHKDNICLNFELLDQSLADYMEDRNYEGLPMTELRPVIYQLATALSHLKSLGIVHADLKPENIMVVDRGQQPLKVKLIDFGLAHTAYALEPGVCVQTTWYRAPEVMLHDRFNEAIDMWSLGVTAAELAIGHVLYPGKMDYDMLSLIIATQGQPEDHVLDRWVDTDCYFQKETNGEQHWRFKTPEEFKYETGFSTTDTRSIRLDSLDDLQKLMVKDEHWHLLLLDLIKKMMHLDPEERITPLGVLQHPFFASSLPKQFGPDTRSDQRSVIMSLNETAASLNIYKGISLSKCHKVMDYLGQGGFGFVTKCCNTETGEMVAIKVNKSHPELFHQAKLELGILKRLRCLDPDTCNIVKWNGSFFHKDSICLNFELLDQNLADYMEDRNYEGLPMTELRPVIYQLATALSHLKSLGIVHADLKPENIMVVDRGQQPLKVKLIDFGLAHTAYALEPGVCVQTTWYRAPEVMLHDRFNEAIDMWSLGVTAAELATGDVLYPGITDYDMLSFIVATQGQPEDHVLDCWVDTDCYFQKETNGEQHWRLKTPEEFKYETGFSTTDIRSIRLDSLDDLQKLMVKDEHWHLLLLDLIKKMMHLDPEERITPLGVLQHPFFASSLPKQFDTCIQQTETEKEKEKEVIRQDSAVETTSASLAEELEENIGDVQDGTNGEKNSWFWHLGRRIRDILCSFFR